MWDEVLRGQFCIISEARGTGQQRGLEDKYLQFWRPKEAGFSMHCEVPTSKGKRLRTKSAKCVVQVKTRRNNCAILKVKEGCCALELRSTTALKDSDSAVSGSKVTSLRAKTMQCVVQSGPSEVQCAVQSGPSKVELPGREDFLCGRKIDL